MNSGRSKMSENVMTEKFGEVRQKWAEMIRSKGNENLADSIETTTATNLSDKKIIQAWVQLHPEFRVELETLREEIMELQEQGEEEIDPSKYFKETKNGSKFIANWLAEEIEDEYSFIHLEDSGQLFVFQEGYYQDRGRELIREECNRRLGDEVMRRRIKEVIGIIEDRSYTERHDFRPPKRKINFKNGVYDLDSEELIPHDPRYNFTHRIPVEYPESPPDCDKIDSFLQSIVKTEEEVKTLKEIAGYCLLPDYPLEKSFVLVGQGSNGKSRYIDFLKNLLGKQNYTNKSLHELEENRFASKKLYGNLACFDDDLPSDKIENSNKMKKLTGGSDVGAEVKYGGQFDFKNYAKLLFATNEMPRTLDNSDGFFRRWIILEFPYTFKTNPDPENKFEKNATPKKELMDAVKDEEQIQGFVWEIVEDLKDVLANDEFTHALEPDQVRQKWREYSVPMIRFIEKYVKQGTTYSEASPENEDPNTITAHSYDYIRKDTLHEMIGLYCQEKSHSKPSKKAIKKALDQTDLLYGIKRTRQEPENKQVPVYSGLRLEIDEELLGGVQGCRVLVEHKTQARVCACKECSKQSMQVCTPSGVKNKLQHIRTVIDELQNRSQNIGPSIEAVVSESQLSHTITVEYIDQLENKGEIEMIDDKINPVQLNVEKND